MPDPAAPSAPRSALSDSAISLRVRLNPVAWARGLRAMPWTLGCVVYGLVYEIARRLVPDDHVAYVTNLGLLPVAVALTVRTFQVAWHARDDRRAARAWVLIGAAFLMTLVGDTGWFVMESIQGEDPTEAWPNVPYFLYYILLFLGLVTFPNVFRTASERTRVMLDAGTIFVAGGLVLWHFVVRPTIDGWDAESSAGVIAIFHPLGDLLTFFGIAVLASRRPSSLGRSVCRLLAAGTFVGFVGNTLWAYLELEGLYETGGFADSMWVIAYVVLLAAGERQLNRPRRRPSTDQAQPIEVCLHPLPYAAAAVGYGLLCIEAFRGDGVSVDLIMGAVGSTVLVVVRHVLAVMENGRLWRERARLLGDARLSAIVRHAADAVLLVDPQGVVTWASHSTTSTTGVEAGALVGRPLARAFPEADPGPIQVLWQRATDARGTPVRDEWPCRRPDGRRVRVECTLTNLVDDPTVGGFVGNVRDVTDRASLEAKLTYQALHDTLTGIANRALFQDRVQHALARALRQPGRLGVLFIDLDGFKTVNDSLGHAAGDVLLIHVARRIQGIVRDADTAARLGGDEFAVLVEGVQDLSSVKDLASRLARGLREPFPIDGRNVTISASIGIAMAEPGDDCGTLLRNADTAMYAAKGSCDRGIVVFEREMHAEALESLDLQSLLRSAPDRGELSLHYQKVVDLETGAPLGLEALLRWRHPERGDIPPARFIPLAESTGLIVPLGLWVLRRALAEVADATARWPGSRPPFVSINVSARQIHDPEFVRTFCRSAREAGIPLTNVLVELTESVLVQRSDKVLRALTDLRRAGVRLGIDDFGTGYSCLAYLHRFPLDVLKIPREFVEQVGRERSDGVLPESILALGRALNLDVIAEGIETEEEAAALRSMGCRLGQGYLFGRPSPMEVVLRDVCVPV
jgi:diguanylate cyclase (GGDEF)-like protein/PAS domain S-box-containing protein